MLLKFITGILICIPLIPLNDLILRWAKKNPLKSIGILAIMMGSNILVILSYGLLMKPEEPKMFMLGILTAILIVIIRKIKRLIN
jgi:hypothetical protein